MRTYCHMAIWTLPRSRRIFDYRKAGGTIKAEKASHQSRCIDGFGAGQGLRCGVYLRLWNLSALGNLRDCRSRWSKDDPTLAYIDPSLGVCGRGDGKALDEILSEAPDPADAGAELGIKGRPADLRVPAQGVELYASQM